MTPLASYGLGRPAPNCTSIPHSSRYPATKTATKNGCGKKKKRNHPCEGKRITFFPSSSTARLNSGLAGIGRNSFPSSSDDNHISKSSRTSNSAKRASRRPAVIVFAFDICFTSDSRTAIHLDSAVRVCHLTLSSELSRLNCKSGSTGRHRKNRVNCETINPAAMLAQ